MKRSLLLMGLALCPLWAVAQAGPTDAWADTGAMASLGEDGMLPWAAGGALSPHAASSPDWVNVVGLDFRGFSDYFRFGTAANGALMCLAGSVNPYATARLNIPHNRKITHFRLWGYDSLPTEGMEVSLWQTCLPDIAPAPAVTNTQLAVLTLSGAPGAFAISTGLNPAHQVNAHLCTYWVTVGFSQCTGTGDLQLRKIQVEHTE